MLHSAMLRIRAVLPFLALGFAACTRASAPSPVAAPPQVALVDTSTPSLTSSSPTGVGPCPYAWTCDDVRWYSSRASCVAACSSECVFEEHYNGHCIPR